MTALSSNFDRNLARALVLSLAAHSLALSPFARPPAAGGNPALNATLRQAPAAPSAPAPLSPKSAEAVTAPVASPEPVERPHTKAPSPAAAAPAPAEGRDAVPEAAPPGPPADTAALPSPAAPAAGPAPHHGVDIAGLRQYHMALARMAARFKHYPPAARAAGQEGRVPMRLEISENGMPLRISLIGTSGFPILDQAALEMMQLAAGHTPVPDALRGQAFSIDLAVDYNLRDE